MNDFIIERDDEEGAGAPEPQASQQPDPNAAVSELAARLSQRLSVLTDAVTDVVRDREEERAQMAAERARGVIQSAEQRVRLAEAAAARAQEALATAIEGGDARAIAAAQASVTDARIAVSRSKEELRAAALRQSAERRTPARPEQEAQIDDRNLRDWKSRHKTWYGVDQGMTMAAHQIDSQIRAAGVIPVGSPEYFEAIDLQMAKKYPDYFGRTPNTGGGASGAGAGRSGALSDGNAVRIPGSIYDGWKRMGINVDDPEVVKRMMGHRRSLVEKGILPAEMVRERVRT